MKNKTLPLGQTTLGAHYDGKGTHFALYSLNATQVSLCLFDETGQKEIDRFDLPLAKEGLWAGYLEGAHPGTIYAYRVSGPYDPENGHRFNDKKVLLDPYAREIVGSFNGSFAFRDDNDTDTASIALKAKVTQEFYDWENDTPPVISPHDMIIYEAHIKGLTKLHPDIPPNIRGTYAGISHHVMLDYLQNLGITSISFLPVQTHIEEPRLIDMGLTNYWGYSPIGYFCPDSRYWSKRKGTTPVSEFKDMVKALHKRGIEVLLDVVYNHTAEGGMDGVMVSFRGIDNATYYRLDPQKKSFFVDYSGCGNTLNTNNPVVLDLVLDSLRFWVQEMHVDGFRFDLAPTLGREAVHFNKEAPFFKILKEDPILSKVKKIAEPWDLGPNGYQLGQFPSEWLEWNDYFRDRIRSFWLQRNTTRGEFTHAAAGSSRIFQHKGLPFTSVNFITAHDGFTLTDLVSYNHKHNEANGENNQDGHTNNYSYNCGEEGPTENPEIQHLRRQFKRSLMAMLFLSQGTPMLLAGDEIGHSQNGNNNAYCQDNKTTWLNWRNADVAFVDFVRKLIRIRKTFPSIGHIHWYENKPTDDFTISWLTNYGTSLSGGLWDEKEGTMGVLIKTPNKAQDSLILLNATDHEVIFRLPEGNWQVKIDSQEALARGDRLASQIFLAPHTILLAIPLL